MKDITKKFFNEIYPKYKNYQQEEEALKQQSLFSGRVGVLAIRGKDKVKSLNQYISQHGLKPVVLEFEETLKLKGKIQDKLKNLDILIHHIKDNPIHNFSGKEKKYFEKFLGKEGLYINTRFSNKKLDPKKVLEVLLIYLAENPENNLLITKEGKRFLKSTKSQIIFPADIKELLEFQRVLGQYNFIKGLTDIRSLNPVLNSKNIIPSSNKVLFTFVHKDFFNSSELKRVKQSLDQIFKNYNRGDLKAKVQVFVQSNYNLVAA